ncbi:HlyD family secretion protein [Pedobacter sp. MR2016-24]|uniref:HlyD family secretion protein n=1 Tax=Pedobacter sp. MR2016-24 TaxID=2994466 RepID=UPI00224860CE|nr:HlyD family efflux transporter periplasmic adaptor subunit [Pedobacter sp. MR2016-24]MCX2485015.1 HlyD family efflux transporter periplasmic adaptor subunit [Pedobacter sp. MR2016-24]
MEDDISKSEFLLENGDLNSDEIQDIITAVPSWILQWGTLLLFTLMVLIVISSAFIKYPDIVKTEMKINSLNAPKPIYVKQNGKIVSLLVKEGALVKRKSLLAFIESTANHEDVLVMNEELMRVSEILNRGEVPKNLSLKNWKLGELQGAYQNFYQQYLQYVSTKSGGYYISKKKFLQRDLAEVQLLRNQIILQKRIKEQEYRNIEREFDSYKKLYKKGVVSLSEYKQQENKYLSGKYPLQQNDTELLNNNSTYLAKQKEILDLNHTIADEKAKFAQSLDNMITETDSWINKYIISAPIDGRVSYAGIVQENQTVNLGQEIFVINPDNTDFFGELQIPQYSMGKVRVGQRTLVKMRSFPYEQYGMIEGRVNYISDVAFKDSIFIAKITFEEFEKKNDGHDIILKNGMQADVDIITQDATILQRVSRNFLKVLDNKY